MRDSETLLQALRGGPLPAGELCRRLGVSQPTLSRWVKDCGDAILRFGRARQTRYARRRELAGETHFALYRVTAAGLLEQWGVLHPVSPQGYVVEQIDERLFEHFDGLPWYLQDMRPQGFLGRSFAQQHAAQLGLPSDTALWSDDQTLLALAASGNDCVGNLLLGERAVSFFLAQGEAPAVDEAQRAIAYPPLAALALAGESSGSSAGGEQPKFLANVVRQGGASPVLVKFSAPDGNASTARWRDLLVCEHLALQTLGDAGLPASCSTLVEADSQVFLEVQRFDRVGRRGRRGVVSLKALDDAFVGQGAGGWPRVTARLLRDGRISAAAHEQAQRLYAFGALIGNSDMHFGNLSFVNDGSLPLSLAPAYDMLPMHFAPRSSGHIATDLPAITIAAEPTLPVWREMLPLAQRYWQQVASCPQVGDDFREIARAMGARLLAMQAQI